MRRLFIFILIFFIAVIFILRRLKRLSSKQTENRLIDRIISDINKEYHQQNEKSADFWLGRLRHIRERYGDDIAKKVADKLQTQLSDKPSDI